MTALFLKYRKNSHRAMTLVEVLVAVFVLTVGILGMLLFFSRSMSAHAIAKDLTVATTHADYVFEEMRIRPTLANIQQTDWEVWAQQEGLNILPQEKIRVSYGNLGGDPLKIDTVVEWERSGRQGKVVVTTEMTK